MKVWLQASKRACFASLKFSLLAVIRRVFLDELGGNDGQVEASMCSRYVRQAVEQVGYIMRVLIS